MHIQGKWPVLCVGGYAHGDKSWCHKKQQQRQQLQQALTGAVSWLLPFSPTGLRTCASPSKGKQASQRFSQKCVSALPVGAVGGGSALKASNALRAAQHSTAQHKRGGNDCT